MPTSQSMTARRNGAGSRPDTTSGYERVAELIRSRELRYADFWFTDLPGRAWRITMPTRDVNEDLFLTGLPLDGQPVGGSWNGVMTLLPQVDAVYADPGASAPTLAMLCDLLDPATHEPLALDPRHVLRRAEEQVAAQLGATVNLGAEPEFLLFDRGRVADEDTLWDFLRAFAQAMSDGGIQVDWFRTGPADGQGRIQMHAGPALQLADRVMLYRRTAANVARRRGLSVAFLPRPVAGGGTPAMPMHQALWRDGRNLFHDDGGWALTSNTCRWYAGGLLTHLPALLAFCAPTTNSYRRLIPGVSGPADAMLSDIRKSAICRIPARNHAPGARRIKFWGPDAMANPYLAFAAVIMAGLDGIARKLEAPVDTPWRSRVPHCLESALDALDADRDFLTRTEVFSDGMIDAWIQERWASQVVPVRSQPHPSERYSDLPGGQVEVS